MLFLSNWQLLVAEPDHINRCHPEQACGTLSLRRGLKAPSKLSRLAGVSEAGACRRNPEQSEGAPKDPENAAVVNAVPGSSLVHGVCHDFFPMRDGRLYKFWVYIMASPSGSLNVGLSQEPVRRLSVRAANPCCLRISKRRRRAYKVAHGYAVG